MKTQQTGLDLLLLSSGLDLNQTFECGQCFRWEQTPDGGYYGVAKGRELILKQRGDDIIFKNTSEREFEDVWRGYFDLDFDYQGVKRTLSADKTLKKACEYAFGIKILKQEPWETLCTFIISQNNNIPRIQGIVSRLCESFGDRISDRATSFPSADKIAALSEDDLAPLRAGFRNKYIIDAARKISSKQVDIDKIYDMPLHEADSLLQTICGVGPKVSACVLLFGFHKIEAFPEDVWIKRAMSGFYKNGLPEFAKPYAGIAQQYLFHYIRTCDDEALREYRKK